MEPRGFASQHLNCYAPHTPDIRLGSGPLVEDNFWSQIGYTFPPEKLSFLLGLLPTSFLQQSPIIQLCKAIVTDFDEFLPHHQDIGAFEIPMNNASSMQV